MGDVLYVDTSTLRSVACSTEVLMRYQHDYTSKEERAYLRAGTAGHLAMAEWFRGGDKAACLYEFEHSYRAWAQENVLDANDRLTWENCNKILDAWFDTHPVSALPFYFTTHELVEIAFAYPLTDDIVFCGRMDGLPVSHQHEAYFVLENKFPGRMNETWTKQWGLDAQLSGYLWAAEQHVQAPVIGAFINGVEFSRLPSDPVRKCSTHATVYAECGHLHARSDLLIVTRTPEQIEEWKRTAINLANRWRELRNRFPEIEQIHQVRMQGTYFNRCQFCAFHDWCKNGRQFAHIDAMLVKEPWEPYVGAFAHKYTHHKP